MREGLFHLDWLMDHRRDFEWLVMERFSPSLSARSSLAPTDKLA
jgi:hypothetical protein